MTDLAVKTNTKVFFTLHEGSNYQVRLINKDIEIIEYEQFTKLMPVLNSDIEFVTVNGRVVNKHRIDDIQPTKLLTKGQEATKKEAEKKEREIELEKERYAIIKKNFDAEFFNGRYGVGKWSMMRLFGSKFDAERHIVDGNDLKACREAFATKYPEIVTRLADIDASKH